MALRFATAVFGMFGAAALAALPAKDRAKEVLEAQRCGGCHDSAISTGNARALAVYDLVEPDWPARMSDAQLPKLLSRLKSAPAADQKTVREFVAAELKSRARRGASRQDDPSSGPSGTEPGTK